MSSQQKIRVAILDMYKNHPNEGLRNLKEIVGHEDFDFEWSVFDVRGKGEVPGMDFDIFISSGGPGSPYDGEGMQWEKDFFNLIDNIWDHNANGNPRKKYVFAICHSFQLLARHFQLGNVCRRKSTAFGVFNIHKTENAREDMYFRNLPDPFYAVDSRDWQLIQPDTDQIIQNDAVVLAIEKRRDHVPYERAIMALRLTKYFYMTQFHPEADATGMLHYFQMPEKRQHVIDHHGEWKLTEMIMHLNDQEKIPLTHDALIPAFLREAKEQLILN
jgi:homoserine O-succinyltransferase/O-acetyltransferase